MPTPNTKSNKPHSFDAQTFLNSAGVARKIVQLKKKETIFSQGAMQSVQRNVHPKGQRLNSPLCPMLARKPWWLFWGRVIFW